MRLEIDQAFPSVTGQKSTGTSLNPGVPIHKIAKFESNWGDVVSPLDFIQNLQAEEISMQELASEHIVINKMHVFPTIPIRKNHWTQIPFDNEMMQGPYTNSAVDGSWRFFFRNTMQIVVVDEKGIFLPADKITAVDVDLVLERTADQSYRLRLCMPIMLENIKLVCKEPHLSIEIKGQIQQVFRTGTFVIIQHTVVKKPEAKDQQAPQHAVSIIDTTNWSLQNYQLPSCAASANASSFSMSVFGNIVFYAVICQDLTVQVYDFHLKGKTAKANLKMTFNNTRDSVPHIFCPSRIHLRKDRELKLAIFDQCPHHNDGVFSDIFVTGWKRGNDFRQVRSFTRHTPGSEIGRICAHRGSIVAVQDSRLFVFRDDVEFLSSRISLPEVEEHGIKTIHCLDHGRILVESPKLVVLLDLNNIHGDRYHPYRKIDISKYAFAQGGIQHVFEDPEGLLIHFGALAAADGKFPVLALQFEAPEVFIKHKEQESVPEAVAVTFEDKRNPKVQRAITFHYKAEFSKEDHREPAVSLKDPSKKIFLQAGKLLKLFSDPLIKTQGEFWEVQVQSDTKALQGSLGLEIKPAVTLAQTPANGVSSFAHSRGVIIYTTVSEDRTSIFSYIDSHEELQLEKSEGTYCIDSAMGHKESTDAGKTDSWAAVFACFNLHSSYLYFVNGGHADVRMIEVDGYILDPRIEMTSESEVYLFGMLPHRDTLYGYYSENVMQINKTAFNMFLNLSYVHDYEVFKFDNQVYLLYTTFKTYKVHLKKLKKPEIPHNPNTAFPMVDDKNSSKCPDVEFNLLGNMIPHSFKCKVLPGQSVNKDVAPVPHITCAFVFDSSHIELVSFRVKKDTLGLELVSSTKLKLFGNFSAVKVDFDEHLLAASGMFVAEPKATKEDGLAGGILVYDLGKLAEREGLFSGRLTAKELGFTPTCHNHHLQIVRSSQQSLVGVSDPQQILRFYRLSEPALSFGDTSKATATVLSDTKLVLRGETGYSFIPLSKLFQLDPAASAPHPGNTDSTPVKPKPPADVADDHDDQDLDVSIPDTPEDARDGSRSTNHEKSSKGHPGVFYILVVLALFIAVRIYYWRQSKRVTSVRYHDPKVHPEQDTQVFDKSI